MKRTQRLIFSFFLLLALTLPTHTARSETESIPEQSAGARLLTLDDCLDIAQARNIGLQRARLATEASLLDRIRAESVFDPGFQLGFTMKDSQGGSTQGSSYSGESTLLDLSLKYIQPVDSGSSWIFSLGQSRSSGTFYTGSQSLHQTSYSSQLGVTYSLQLLEGAGERINRLTIDQADLQILRSEAAVNEAQRNLRFSVIQTYTAAVLAERQIEVAELSLRSAQNLVENVKARIDAGLLAPYELLAAQAGLAEREEALINAQSAFQTSLDALKEVVGLPLADEIQLDTTLLAPFSIDVDPDAFFVTAQNNRPDLLDIELRARQAQLNLLLAQDRLQPSLSWDTQVTLSGSENEYFDAVADMNDLSWATGFQYSIPLGGNRAARVDVAAARLNLEQLELEKVQFLRSLERDIRAAVDQLNNALLRIDVTQQGLKVQEVKIESERARLELGLITSRDLLEFDLQLANARLAYASAIADALNAVARLEFLTGDVLLDDITFIPVVDEQAEETPSE